MYVHAYCLWQTILLTVTIWKISCGIVVIYYLPDQDVNNFSQGGLMEANHVLVLYVRFLAHILLNP